jgi:hypothetical protein
MYSTKLAGFRILDISCKAAVYAGRHMRENNAQDSD